MESPTTVRFSIAATAIALLALAFAPAQLKAQQAYPSPPYGAYPNQYAQPGYQQPRYGYTQPQYANPQYAQPQYQQPYADQQPYAAPTSPYAQPDLSQPAPAPAQFLSAQDLEQLLAPIALYPDALLAQILAASTYPAEVAVADQWVQQMRAQGYGSPDQIAAGAQAQTDWDPSIKALTAFPDVLDMMDRNLEWTTNLGNAYYNQPQDVMQTVQVLRQRAEQAGNLQTTPQEDVTNDQGYIEVAPPNPQVVYVPTYDPWDVYGAPIAPYPGFSLIGALGTFFGGAPVQYGLSFALGAFWHFPFGWVAWGLDWLGHAVLFDHSHYYTRSASVRDWGLPHGGPRAYYGYERGGDRWRDGSNRAYGDHGGYNQGNYGQRGGWGNNRGPGQSYVRPAQGFPEPGRLNPGNNFNRGYQDNRGEQSYARPAPQENYGYRPQTYPNRAQTYSSQGYPSRPQNFSSPATSYGSGYANRSANAYSGQTYAARPGFSYADPYRAYRAPEASSSRAFAGRSHDPYGNTMARNDHSGGFHLFGGGKESKPFGSERTRKYSSTAPKGFGGSHTPRSFGGGHAPSMSHFGGGGGHGHHR